MPNFVHESEVCPECGAFLQPIGAPGVLHAKGCSHRAASYPTLVLRWLEDNQPKTLEQIYCGVNFKHYYQIKGILFLLTKETGAALQQLQKEGLVTSRKCGGEVYWRTV
jgi:hypothetical protein